ncbi:MAG: FkbM family methyltransferase [Xanthobacteraceae bacterium]
MRIYYGNAARRSSMDQFYAQFVARGDLVFDIGAHVGGRIGAFRRLGARVIAAEPQPALVRILKLIYGRDVAVTIEAVAIGARPGIIDLDLNLENPTVASASRAFIRAAQGAPGWEGQSWSRTISVPVTTLDELMVRYGRPSFIKIDVEGFEAQALAGLTRPTAALSFEFTTIQRDVAGACVAHCEKLGYRQFNGALGETHELVHPQWLDATAIASWLAALPHAVNSGDIYARTG